jgi:hypothetical protein
MKSAFLFSVHVGRRRALHGARDILIASGLPACAPRIGLPVAHDDGRFLDAHCHVFNRDGEATERRLSAFYGGDKPAALLRAAA